MFDVVTIGSSVVDIFIESTAFELDESQQRLVLRTDQAEKVEVDSFKVTTGGGGSNTAVGLARAGFRTAVVSELGTDTWSQLVLNDLEKEEVDTSLLIHERLEETGGSVIFTIPNGGRTIMVHRGASSMLDPHDIPAPVLAQSGWIHLTSIAGRLDTLNTIFSVITNQKRRFSWNPGKAEIKLLVDGQLDLGSLLGMVLFVNQSEWEALDTVQAQLHQHFRQIIVTKGKDGGEVYQDGQSVYRYQSPQVKIINETGAGDSFASGYVAALINGLELKTQIAWGQKNATSVIQQQGAKAGLLTEADLQAATDVIE